MRTFAIVTVLIAFGAAVILPNDIGTHNLPATKCKCVKSEQGHPLKGRTAAWLILPPKQCERSPADGTQLVVYRSAQSIGKVQLTSPLLI